MATLAIWVGACVSKSDEAVGTRPDSGATPKPDASLPVHVSLDAASGFVEPDASDASDASNGSDASDAGEDAPVACSGPDECWSYVEAHGGPAFACCAQNACVFGQAAESAQWALCTDAAVLVDPSKYDQSCATDSDCAAIVEGYHCFRPGPEDACAGTATSAISKSAYMQLQAKLANLPVNPCRSLWQGCVNWGPCCRGGTCQMGAQCFPGTTTPADASADGNGGPDNDGPAD
jgi:hypothetical protein